MLNIHYTFSDGTSIRTVTQLDEIDSPPVRSNLECRLRRWSQSLRAQSLRHLFETKTGAQHGLTVRVEFHPPVDE